MPYNLTNLTGAGEISDILVFSNEVTHGTFFLMMIVAIFFIILMVLRRFPFIDTLLVDSFICMMLSFFLAYSGFLSYTIPLVFLFFVAGLLWFKHSDEG